jgi:transcription-repair coupling factor (superfamily II helicase)
VAALAPSLVRALPASSRPLAELIERLRTPLAPDRGFTFALHETTGSARPYLLAALHDVLAGQIFVVVATSDVAERTFTDLTYYLGERAAKSVALLRARDETLGALESPSERSARMTLLADLCARKPQVIVAPVAALRQFVIPRRAFEDASFQLGTGTTADWDATLERLYRLGYARVDVVSAAGEYAVRGGILDMWPATTDTPVRVEFFGDDVESIRAFDLQSQRSTADLDAVTVTPWLEILRDETLRENVLARAAGEANVVSALRAYLAGGADVPEPWLGLAYDEQATVLDYLHRESLVVLEEPGMLDTIEHGLEEERSRGAQALMAGVDSGELDVRDDEVGEALLADVVAPYPRLAAYAQRLRARRVLVVTGGIETGDLTWLPPALDAFVLETRPAEHFNRRIELFTQQVRDWVAAGDTVWLVANGASRLAEILRGANVRVERSAPFVHLRAAGTQGASRPGGAEPQAERFSNHGVPAARNAARGSDGIAIASKRGTVYVDQGSLESGFSIPMLHLHVLGDREIYGQPAKRVKLRAVKEGVPVTLADLKVGDYVVHAVHGIAQYLGLRKETILGATSDYLSLKYAGTDRMLVPVHQMHQVNKYSASEGAAPRLSKMGGADWARTKTRVSEKLAQIAEGLVALYAEREVARGHAFAPDTPWQAELEESFPYEPTPDQAKAIDDTKRDMETDKPMDRLVCGDVGYGKTEVAVRAIFKAIAGKKQVAVLCPTTLLASQHHRTFTARFASFPIRIEELSRFKTKKEAQAILNDLAQGKVDVVVGTHRILQKDVVFRDLGLIVVDEEQRFGVMHKERLKQLKATVDVLTLSATPIPRTLQMSLMGVRDLSLIQTAPKNRMSIKTVVVPASDAVVQRAIVNELDRGGQVYYVHNRIESIYGVARALEQLVPKARIAVGHGQMREHELEPVMTRFIDGELDVFVSTTIIENGIDIPNVNTIVVNDADKFGLAQLYQLRGRVGRSNHQAYAFLLYQAHKALSEDAKARLEAIREFTHLGSGLQIAMRDLEIRGAGNLLGAAQSGFIGAVGFETYVQLLAEAIAERKGTVHQLHDAREAVIDVKLDAYVPDDYIPQVSQKIAIYQQLAAARTLGAVEDAVASVRDRFGPPPPEFEALVEITRLRVLALKVGVTRVVINEQRLTLGVGSGFALDPESIPRLQSITKNKFRFGEGRITIDLPARTAAEQLPTLHALLEAL